MNPPNRKSKIVNRQSSLVIFDCDGVLVDSVGLERDTLLTMAAELGLSIADGREITQFQGGAIRDVAVHIEQKLGRPLDIDAFVQEFRQRSYVAYDQHLRPIPGIERALNQITLPYCVASSGPVEKIRRNLTTTGLLPRFEGNIFSCYDINRWKPEPDIFLYAARQMGTLPEHCLVVEDSVLGVQAAIAAGMRVLGFAGTEPAAALAQEGAEVFDTMVDLPMMLASY